MQHDYVFKKLSEADFPLIRTWFAEPHMGNWWGDVETEIALMREDLDNGPTDMRVVHLDGHPFAYVQDYPAHHWNSPQYAKYHVDARGIDTFLGDPKFLGKGHAAAYLRQRATQLVDRGCPVVLVDPDPKNTAALRAYRAAGFEGDEVLPSEDGDPVVVLKFSPELPTSKELK